MKIKIIAALVFLVIIGGVGFGAYIVIKNIINNRGGSVAQKTSAPLSLSDYADKATSQVRLTIEGPVTAVEKHTEQVMTISAATRTIQVFKEYSSTPVYDQSYPNNQAAYADFMQALENAGFTKNTPSTKLPKDEVGLCPSGKRFVYEVLNGPAINQRLWSTSCGDATAFKGINGTIQSLFQTQIPDYNHLPSDMRVEGY